MKSKSFIIELFNELEILKNQNVITEDSVSSIKNYYQNQLAEIEKSRKQELEKASSSNTRKSAFVLSIIASIFVFGGIVSLIAYNWRLIPRSIKTLSAFIISFSPIAVYLLLKNKLKEAWFKEFSASLWTLLFGASIAFISQIYRLPSDSTNFLIIWSIFAIIVTYSLSSFASFLLSLVLIFAYTIVAQFFDFSSAVFFYLLLASLIPFVRKRKEGRIILLIYLASFLEIVLEKKVPGLWILGYSFLASIFLSYGLIKNNEPFKVLGIIGNYILLIILLIPYFWNDVGFYNSKIDLKYLNIENYADVVVICLIMITSVFLFIKSIKITQKEDKLLFVFHILPLTFLGIFILCNFNLYSENILKIVLFALCIFGFILFIVKKVKIFLPFCAISIVSSIISCSDFIFENEIFSIFVFILFIFYYFYFYTHSDFFKDNEVKIISLLCLSFSLLIIFFLLEFVPNFKNCFFLGIFNLNNDLKSYVLACNIFAFIVLAFLPIVKSFLNRKIRDYFVFGIAILSLFASKELCLVYKIVIVMFFIFEIIEGIKERDLLKINFHSILVLVIFIVKFFFQIDNLLVRGVVFIFAGIFILLLNIFMMKFTKNKKLEKKNEK